jgi:DNA-binding ferritin-like protein
VSRRQSWIAILAFLIVATALTTALVTPDADASTPLRGKLRVAKRELRQAHDRLQAAEAALAAALTGTTDPAGTLSGQATALPETAAAPTSVDQLKAKVAKARQAVRVWRKRVRRIARRVREQLQIADWERHAKWMPIIEIAARKYHVKADGMYRMMMRESGGRRFAGADSAFKGLFQYWTGTWAASWNPGRHDSIYDGSSQIFATACAIHRGMGPQMWTTTFASQY